MVDDGGVFHFIANHDFNFDGINDEDYHLAYDTRTYSTRYGGHYDDTIIKYVSTEAKGVGISLNSTFSFYDWENKVIDLHLNRDNVEFEHIKITVAFHDADTAKRISFYAEGSKLIHTVNKDNTASIVFNADNCKQFQNNSDNEFVRIDIQYTIN